nr:MAG TPA: hypothetical protein [Caudoviricetes sp.]
MSYNEYEGAKYFLDTLFFVEMTGILTSLEAFDLYCFSFCQFYQ